jgi:uncharacterized membrane protein (UPF0127 family)
MMSTARRLLAAALLPVLLTGPLWFGAAQATDSQQVSATASDLDRIFRRSTLQIATPDARVHPFNIWIADDDQRRARGLMFIKQLGPEDGMLFVYPSTQPIAMWMKNTYVPLDMLFVAADGKVTHVVANTKPLSLATIESGGPVLGVVELPAGSAARLKIAPGARVIHPAFSAPQ